MGLILGPVGVFNVVVAHYAAANPAVVAYYQLTMSRARSVGVNPRSYRERAIQNVSAQGRNVLCARHRDDEQGEPRHQGPRAGFPPCRRQEPGTGTARL